MGSTESKHQYKEYEGPKVETTSGESPEKLPTNSPEQRAATNLYIKRGTARFLSFIGVLLFAISLSLFLLMFPSNDDIELFNRFFPDLDFKATAVIVGLGGGLVLAAVLQYEAFMDGRKSPLSFVEIDERASSRRLEFKIMELERQLKQLRAVKSNETSPEKSAPVAESSSDEVFEFSAIEHYIGRLTKSLDRHIELSEIKASKLLDTGTSYLRRGIYAYVISIGVWQVVAYYRGVDSSLIYGVISCSLAFLVVEFLAAWFLKQYRNFIDSSVQFMRVKSVFDRYMLSYYAVKEFSVDGAEGVAEAKAQVLKVLAEEIKWPEPLGTKAGDVNHMVQMFESLAGVLDKVKSGAVKNDKGGS